MGTAAAVTTAGRRSEFEWFDACVGDPAWRGCVLVGGAGVGKTHLASAFAHQAELAGNRVGYVSAGRSALTLPLGAFIPHLPPLELSTVDLHRAVSDLLDRFLTDQQAPNFLVVDDCHLLDTTSALFLKHLANSGHCRLVLTYRASEAVPELIGDLWISGLLDRRRIDPLDRIDTAYLVALGLGGPVNLDLVETLYARTLGNPLFVRELLFAGRDTGSIDRVDGEWDLVAALPVTDRLRELIEVRLAGLSEPARHITQLVALDEPLELSIALLVGGAEVLAEAESRGVLALEHIGRRAVVVFTHPMLFEVIEAAMGPLERQARTQELVRVRQGEPLLRRGDMLRLAALSVEAGVSLSDEVSIDAVAAALISRNSNIGLRLLEKLSPKVPSFRFSLVAGLAHLRGGDRAVADEHFADAASCGDQAQLVELAIERAHSLAHHFGDVASAASLIEEVLPAVTDEHLRVSVEVALAELTGWGGHMADAVVLSEAVLQRPDLDADAALSATSLLVFARAQTGPFDVLASLVVEGRKLVKATKGEARIYALWLYAGEFNHAFFARDLSAATIIARRYQSPDSSPEVPDDFRAVGAVTEAMASVFSGRSIDATGQLAQGRALLGDADPYELVAYLEAMSAIVSAHRGDERVLAKRVDRFLEQRHGRTTHSAGIADYAIAHLEAIRNGPKAGVAVARERANQTITVDGTLSWASLSLLLGPRLGEPGQVVDDLASVADAIGGVLVPCGASHARALIDRDGDALIECAQTYGRAGFLLFAAEAAEQAAIVAMTEGSEVPAARFRLLRDRWLLSCQPFWSTTLTDIKPVITARERDVLSPIAEGLTTRECAELLFLSAKTVENHLGRMYRRFGVGGRAELLSLVDTLN